MKNPHNCIDRHTSLNKLFGYTLYNMNVNNIKTCITNQESIKILITWIEFSILDLNDIMLGWDLFF